MMSKIQICLIVVSVFLSCSKSQNPLAERDFMEVNVRDSLLYLPRATIVANKLKILDEVERLKNDSIRTDLFFKLSYLFYKANDSTNFAFWNQRANVESSALKDTMKIAESYWDLGNFYFRRNYIDSSFYYYNRAHHLYEIKKDEYFSARMLLNMAIIQKNIKDYVGSEVSTIKAIKKLRPLQKHRQLYIAYNNLGILYNELQEYPASLKYHEEAMEHVEQLNDAHLKASSMNNVGVVLHNSGKYVEAIKAYEKAFSMKDLLYVDAELYAMLLDNLAHSQLKNNDTSGLSTKFYRALEIRDSIDHRPGVTINKLHLGEWYLLKGDTASAVKHSGEAMQLARSTQNYRDLLDSMLFLSRVDKKKSQGYLEEFIILSDSLLKKERAVRNKFARIQFETDEFIAENEQLTEQKNWLIGGSVGLLAISFLSVVVFRQKVRNKRLENERDQQKANEEIYRLLLDQENRMEEGRNKEKERISKELHDGVLSKLFGIRFNLSNLNAEHDETSLKTKEKHLNGLRKIEEEIRLISHDLQQKDFGSIGFLNILKHFLEEQETVLGFKPSLESDEEIHWEGISNVVKMNSFRIIQEALQNIKKYSEALKAEVIFEKAGEEVKLTIRDNGKGFDVNKKQAGIGLKNIKARVKDINGSLKLSSNTEGTIIIIKIPVTDGSQY